MCRVSRTVDEQPGRPETEPNASLRTTVSKEREEKKEKKESERKREEEGEKRKKAEKKKEKND